MFNVFIQMFYNDKKKFWLLIFCKVYLPRL